MATLNHLYILADHIKLSLIDRQRATSSLALGASVEARGQDGHIARSLEQMGESIEALKGDMARLEKSGNDEDQEQAEELADALPTLQRQLDELTSQFHGFTATPYEVPELTTTTGGPISSSLPTARPVRFRDDDTSSHNLFGLTPSDAIPPSYHDEVSYYSNAQIHTYHDDIMAEQDEHLDRLGESISRQRELSERIGEELEAQVEMLEETEGLVDRQASGLDRARRGLRMVVEREGDAGGCGIIVTLIIILLVLIMIFK